MSFSSKKPIAIQAMIAGTTDARTVPSRKMTPRPYGSFGEESI
jgi:hypothetical protein